MKPGQQNTVKTLKALLAFVLFAVSITFASAGQDKADSLGAAAEAAPAYTVPALPEPLPTPAVGTDRAAGKPLNVYFINVGMGDSIYLELPDGTNALIDGGPSKNPSGLFATFMKQHNITKLDNVVLTHPHSDHYTGLEYVFSNIPVTNFYDTKADNTGTVVDEAVRKMAQDKGAHTFYPAADEVLPWDTADIQVKVLNSCSSPVQATLGQILNDCSIVLKITYQNSSILLTGDMQSDAETALVTKYGSGLKADVLKVGHHGSQYSSSAPFLALVKPLDAYIMVGAGNNYNFPTPDCRARLLAAGARVHRTDTDGTMEYVLTGAPPAAK